MKFTANTVGSFSRFSASSDQLLQHDSLQLLLCNASAVVTTNPGIAGLWWPIKGQAFAVSPDARLSFGRKSILISDSHRAQEIFTGPDALVIAILGSQNAWAAISKAAGVTPLTEPALFPALHDIDGSIRRQLLLMIRGVLDMPSRNISMTEMTMLGLLIRKLQGKFETLIDRSPGQNMSKRKAAFMRLQRIRNVISFGTRSELDVKSLAHMANYSVWHFIRVYDCVFGETPYVHISRSRVDRANELIRGSQQCIGDIALSVGFESRTTLTRAIKKRYGISASQLRHAEHRKSG